MNLAIFHYPLSQINGLENLKTNVVSEDFGEYWLNKIHLFH